MPFCTAYNCTNRQKKGCGKTFHRFPRGDSSLLKRWIVNMRRDNWIPGQYSSICSDHFAEECFDLTGQTTRLRSDAVPTLFNFPQHLIKNVKQRKPPIPRDTAQPHSALKQVDDSNLHIAECSNEDPARDTYRQELSTPIKPKPLADSTESMYLHPYAKVARAILFSLIKPKILDGDTVTCLCDNHKTNNIVMGTMTSFCLLIMGYFADIVKYYSVE